MELQRVHFNLRTCFLQDTDSGGRAFPGCSSRWVSQPRPAALSSWELLGALPPLQQQHIPKLAEPLSGSPATELHKATAQGTSLDFFLEFCLEFFVTEEKWKNLSDQTGLWNHPETCWIFIIAGCLELAWEWKKTQFLKNHYILWVRRILNLLCRKHWVPYGAIKGLTYRVIHTLTPCYILEISF